MVTSQSTHTLADLAELPDDSPIYDIFGGELVVRNILSMSPSPKLACRGNGRSAARSRSVTLGYTSLA